MSKLEILLGLSLGADIKLCVKICIVLSFVETKKLMLYLILYFGLGWGYELKEYYVSVKSSICTMIMFWFKV